MRADEQADAAVGGGAGQHRRDAEQQQVGQRVALALGPTRVGDPVQGGEQAGERHHGSSRGEGSTLNSSGAPPVPRPPAPPSQRLMARTEQPCTVDQVARGRSGFDPSGFNKVAAGKAPPKDMPVLFSASHEAAWTIFRFGPKYPQSFPNLKFPLSAQDEFWKQMVPDLNLSLPTPNPTLLNLSALARKLGGAVMISHSESGPFPFQTAAIRAAGIAGIISIEPGSCSGFDKDIRTLARIPTVVLYGDYVSQFPNWASSLQSCQQFVQQLRKAGGDAQVIQLPDLGIHGNSHMLMQDKNNLQVADLLLDWIDGHVERKAAAAP